MKNWKTTVGGLLLTIGTALQGSEDSMLKFAGSLLLGVGGLTIGLFAKDNNVTGVGRDARSEKEIW